MATRKVKVGIIGCGHICKSTYLPNMFNEFEVVDVVACADKIPERARWMENHFPGVKAVTVEQLLIDPEIQVVVNLTYPESHVEISKAAFEHNKNVYCEKMMAGSFADGKMLYDMAKDKGLMFTTAPDTFLGAWAQSARKYIDDGIIGQPRTFHAQISRNYDLTSPFFDTKPRHYFFSLHYAGGFPFDLGGYYLHTLINLFGTVKRVCGFGGNLFPERTFLNPKHPRYKERFIVDTPTTLTAALEFENGVIGTFNISSDTGFSHQFYVGGSDGTMTLGDPNNFSSPILVKRAGARPDLRQIEAIEANARRMTEEDPDSQLLMEYVPEQEVELPLLHGFYKSLRGVGLADMCYAILNGRRPRCHADIGLHALEIIEGIQISSQTGELYEMTTRCERPVALHPSAWSPSCQEETLDD